MTRTKSEFTKSREVINAIKEFALKKIDTPFKISEACKDLDVYNPHAYTSDAIDELRSEGFNMIKKGNLWMISTEEVVQQQPDKNTTYFDDAKSKVETGDKLTFVPVKKEKVHVDTGTKPDLSSASLHFIDQIFNTHADLISLLATFGKLASTKKVCASVKIKFLN